MPNRSIKGLPELPVVYQYVGADYPGAHAQPIQPWTLNVYDVTFLHFHNLIEIGYCSSGEGICYVEDKAYPFRAGDIQIVFPFQQHFSKSTGDMPSTWRWLNVDGTALLTRMGMTDMTVLDCVSNQERGVSGIIDREKYPMICTLAKKMVREVFEPKADRINASEYYGACFCMLITELYEISGKSQAVFNRNDKLLKEIAPALLSIRNAVDAGLVPEVATLHEMCAVSMATFRRKFKAAVGMSAKDYVTACRMQRAGRLLLSTYDKVIEVASQCGFAEVSGFNRCFQKYMGLSPSDYRKRHGQLEFLHPEQWRS